MKSADQQLQIVTVVKTETKAHAVSLVHNIYFLVFFV